ncbi:MAG: M56 family metallopeptidase [Candidatus Aminicenantes bacterium]|nr:M56 family metallopeptidase [Candidatus Aminicenantes bacterium]
METLFQFNGFAVLVELFLKSSLLLSIALGLTFLARKQPASVRHFVLGFSLLGLLVLPFLAAFMPGWRTGLLPSWTPEPGKSTVTTIAQSLQLPPPNAGGENRIRLQAHYSTQDEAAAGANLLLKPQYRVGFTALWLLVSGFLLVKILFGLYGASRLTRQGISINGYPWQQLFLWFLEKMSLKRNVRLIKNQRVAMPMTWGVINPVVLMPPDSAKWPMEHCSSVLFHELSHVKRGDFLVMLLCRIACSLYWLNPLSWIAFKLLRKEQEKACDEMVLKAGIKPSTYASALLRMKQAVDVGRYMPSPALGMAGNSELNERLTTILEKKFKTKEIKMKTKLMLLVLVFLTITFIGTAKPEQTQSAAKTQQTATIENKAADTEKTQTADEEKKKETEKAVHKCSEECLKKCMEKGQHKCSEECLKKCKEKCLLKDAEKGEHKCIMKCMHKGDGDAKEKKIVIIIKDDEDDKGENEKTEKIIICPGSSSHGEKDIEKHLKEIEKSEGKEGKCCKHIMICRGKEGKEGAEPKIIEIKEGKEGEEEEEIVILKKGTCAMKGAGKSMKLELISENKIDGDILNKIKESVKTLQGKLPELCKVTTELSETAQKISIDCPMDKPDHEACKTAHKNIEEFEKEFKNLFPDKEGKKPLLKKMYIKLDAKEEKEED